MIIEVPGNSTDNDTEKGSQKIRGFNELLKCLRFFLYFTRVIHGLKIYAAKIKKIFELKRINIT
jgi:hypothetical protein